MLPQVTNADARRLRAAARNCEEADPMRDGGLLGHVLTEKEVQALLDACLMSGES